MTRITMHLLTVMAGHDFNNVVHQSIHASVGDAERFARDYALPAARAVEDPEWHDGFYHTINAIDYHRVD